MFFENWFLFCLPRCHADVTQMSQIFLEYLAAPGVSQQTLFGRHEMFLASKKSFCVGKIYEIEPFNVSPRWIYFYTFLFIWLPVKSRKWGSLWQAFRFEWYVWPLSIAWRLNETAIMTARATRDWWLIESLTVDSAITVTLKVKYCVLYVLESWRGLLIISCKLKGKVSIQC